MVPLLDRALSPEFTANYLRVVPLEDAILILSGDTDSIRLLR